MPRTATHPAVPIDSPGTRWKPDPMHRWIDDSHIEIDGSVFRLHGAPGPGPGSDATREEHYLMKPRWFVERYLRGASEFRGGRVFEVGIFRGGSTAFFAAILDPEKLVAIDLDTHRNAWLDAWLARRGQSDRVVLHHGVDQADGVAIDKLVAEEFGGQPLDLVIDDASHLLTPTTATFNLLFPRLRPGGLYVIEDWSADLIWKQGLAPHADLIAQRLRDNPELLTRTPEQRLENEMWRLVLRLAMAVGTKSELIPEMEMARGVAAFRRGPVDLDPATFDLADWVPETPV